MSLRSRAVLVIASLGWLALAVVPAAGAQPARPAPPAPPPTERLAVTRPMVIAYLVVPEGAVDTCPDLAVIADDWSYAMATLGDSLGARGVAHALVTESMLRVAPRGARAVTIALGATGESGFVFARPGVRPCLRRGWLDPDTVLAAAGRFLAPAARRAVRPDGCEPFSRP